MPDRAILVVVAVRDPGLRSLLAAELSIVDVELLTAGHYLQVPAQTSEPALAIVDAADMGPDVDTWLEALAAEKRWPRLAIVIDDAAGPAEDRWPVHVSRRSAAQSLREIIQKLNDLHALTT